MASSATPRSAWPRCSTGWARSRPRTSARPWRIGRGGLRRAVPASAPGRRGHRRCRHTSLHNPDWAAYARLCGATGIKADHRDQLDGAMTQLFAADGPALLHVEQDPELL